VRVLLDTHIFIWWSSESERLTPNIFYLLQQPETVIYVSLISLWEIQIKNQLGKLLLSESLQDIFYRQSKNRIS
jgi:PIN domain nuclease of toxin-antitoxin system